MDRCLNSVRLETSNINEIFFLNYSKQLGLQLWSEDRLQIAGIPKKCCTIFIVSFQLLFTSYMYGQFNLKRPLNGVNKWQKSVKKNFFCRGNFTPFLSKKVQIWDHFFPLLFPKDFEYLKFLDIGLQEVGAKRPLNWVNKCKKNL